VSEADDGASRVIAAMDQAAEVHKQMATPIAAFFHELRRNGRMTRDEAMQVTLVYTEHLLDSAGLYRREES